MIARLVGSMLRGGLLGRRRQCIQQHPGLAAGSTQSQYKAHILNIFVISLGMSEGSVQVIFGPMFSGKSSSLLRLVRRYQHAGKSCLVVGYAHGSKYSGEQYMTTHDRQTIAAVKATSLFQIEQEAMQHEVVAIDEGQFFNEIVEFCQELADRGVIVIVAALDATHDRKPFANVARLLPIAQAVTKLSAICSYCSKEASFTQKASEPQNPAEDQYRPTCRGCHSKTSPLIDAHTDTESSAHYTNL